jgi:glutathione S-transferase
MPELLALPFSPWSEKARWALDLRRVPYAYRIYQPIVGELALRTKLRRARGRVTVPVLTTDDGKVLDDSTHIARWADARGEGPTLFPAEHEAAIARFVELSERALDASRTLTLTRMLEDEEALAEMVPRPLQRLRGIASRVGAFGIRRTLRKHARDRVTLDAHRGTLTAALDEIRGALAHGAGDGPRTLLGVFTFADIAVSQAVTCAGPPAFGLKLRPASRRCWTDPEVRSRYEDLLTWRDALYDRYRPRVGS